MRPVPVEQRRHPEIDLALDIEMPVLIASRHFLALDLFGELMGAVYPHALVATSFPPTDFKQPIGFLVYRHSKLLLSVNGFDRVLFNEAL